MNLLKIKNSSVFLILLVLSCAKKEEKINENVPDLTMYEMHYYEVKNGELRLEADAQMSYTYNEKKQQELESVQFKALENGAVKAYGSSDFAKIDTLKNDVYLEDNIKVRYEKEKINMESNYIYFSNEEKMLFGKEYEFSSIVRDNGDILNGKGFEFDLRSDKVVFRSDVYAKLKDEEK